MVPVTSLWLPVLVSAVIVFVASSILHMVLPFHRKDYRAVPSEDGEAVQIFVHGRPQRSPAVLGKGRGVSEREDDRA